MNRTFSGAIIFALIFPKWKLINMNFSTHFAESFFTLAFFYKRDESAPDAEINSMCNHFGKQERVNEKLILLAQILTLFARRLDCS